MHAMVSLRRRAGPVWRPRFSGGVPARLYGHKKNSLVGVTCSNGRRMVRLLAELVQSRWWPHAWPHMS